TATINVLLAPSPSMSFNPTTIGFNSTSTLTFSLANNNTANSLTGIGFTDTLPSGLVVATPNGLTGTCTTNAGGVTPGTITATAGAGSISLSGLALAQSTSCSFAVNVLATSLGVKSNTTSVITSNEGGSGGTVSAGVTV